MIDSVQLILFVVIVVLTVLLVVLGFQVYFILKELRKTLQKANKVLDDTGTITEGISRPLSSLSAFSLGGLKAGSILSVAKVIKGLLSKDDDENKKKE